MRLIWLPEHYEAAVAITDDPDNGTFAAFQKIYNLLRDLNLPTTRAVWVYPKEEDSGTPPFKMDFFAPLLTEPGCLAYCKQLHSSGFEICLHGASSGNNSRKLLLQAFAFLEKEIAPSKTFIFHSKNAENLYWDSKCANSKLFQLLLKLYTSNKCFGEIKGSKYFWGDKCREKIQYIRLFRTRKVNTLAFNPDMPYHDFNKPYVNFWFSATKGYLPKLLTQASLDLLCKENGLCLMYQYLHKYVNEQGDMDPEVHKSLVRLAEDPRVFVRPASQILDRLKQVQLLIPVSLEGKNYLINASKQAVESAQLDLQDTDSFSCPAPFHTDKSKRKITIESIKPMYALELFSSEKIKSKAPMKIKKHRSFTELLFPMGTVVANLTEHAASLQKEVPSLFRQLPAKDIFEGYETAVFYKDPEAERLEILQPISENRLNKLFFGQMMILLREHLFLGRKISTNAYLNNPGKVEDQRNW